MSRFPRWLALAAFAAMPAISQWSPAPFDGARSLVAAGSSAAVLRYGLDPLRSVDGGARWTPFVVNRQRPSEVAMSPASPQTWYAVTESGLYRSDDGGATWSDRSPAVRPLPNAPLPTYAQPRVGADPDLLYSVYQERVGACFIGCTYLPGAAAVSRDGGLTWKVLGLTGVEALYPSASDPRVVYAKKPGAVLRSDDQGATWKDVSPPPPPNWSHLLVSSMVLDARDPRIAYLVMLQDALQPPVAITRDGGETWSWTILPGRVVADPLQAGRAYVFADDGSLRETRDGGITWAQIQPAAGQRDPAVSAAVLVSDGRRIAARVGQDGRATQRDISHGALALGSDLWWNPAESGRGLSITLHASGQAFVVWYAYDAQGAPVWRVVPGGTWNDRTFAGTLYEARGMQWFGTAFDPGRVAVSPVGDVTIEFTDESRGLFRYQAHGASGEIRIVRQQFGPPAAALTENFADLWWNASEPGWGMAINHQHNTIFATWYVYGDDGKPLWVVMPDAAMSMTFVGALARPVARGDIYATRGPSGPGPFDPAQVVATKVGSATITFTSRSEAQLAYEAFGRAATRSLTRQPF